MSWQQKQEIYVEAGPLKARIAALEAEVERLRYALKPFATAPHFVFRGDQLFAPIVVSEDWIGGGLFTSEDFRCARAALNGEGRRVMTDTLRDKIILAISEVHSGNAEEAGKIADAALAVIGEEYLRTLMGIQNYPGIIEYIGHDLHNALEAFVDELERVRE